MCRTLSQKIKAQRVLVHGTLIEFDPSIKYFLIMGSKCNGIIGAIPLFQTSLRQLISVLIKEGVLILGVVLHHSMSLGSCMVSWVNLGDVLTSGVSL